MDVDLERYGASARVLGRGSLVATVAAGAIASFGLLWLVLGLIAAAFPGDLTVEDRWIGGSVLIALGFLPLPPAVGLVGLAWWLRRRLDRLSRLAALVRRGGVLDKGEVERELGIGPGSRRKLVERAVRRRILVDRPVDLAALAPSTAGEHEPIGGAYEKEGVLYVGRSGPVYRVRQIRTGQRYALKHLAPGDHLPAAEIERIANMALATTDLRHPNLVHVLDVDRTTTGEVYLVMELLEGESAEVRVARSTPLPIPEALRFIHQVAAALVAVHGTGHFHGGLSLAEVYLTPDDEGGERAVLTPLGPALEPVSDDEGRAADIRAVGALLREMLADRPPSAPLAALLERIAATGAGGGFETMEELRAAIAVLLPRIA